MNFENRAFELNSETSPKKFTFVSQNCNSLNVQNFAEWYHYYGGEFRIRENSVRIFGVSVNDIGGYSVARSLVTLSNPLSLSLSQISVELRTLTYAKTRCR